MESTPLPTSDRFQIRRQLGAGSMGVVYEAFDRKLGTRVALKSLRNVDPHAVFRFKKEFRALQDLQHPNLVNLGELVEADGHWFFTMELIDGTDLKTWVRGPTPGAGPEAVTVVARRGARRAKLESEALVAAPIAPASTGDRGYDERRLRETLRQLTAGLHALHAAGKIHRDIKPSNVLVANDGRVVLVDFGLIADASLPNDAPDDAIVGTIGYMSPEQAASAAVEAPSDWYGVGCVLYELLTGRLPHEGTPLQVLLDKQRTEPEPVGQIVSDLPSDLEALCMALLQFEPCERPDAAEVMALLGTPDADARYDLGLTSTSRSGPFLGRDAELTALRTAFEDSRHAGPVTVFVRGESGLGKSELAHQFAAQVDATADAVVLVGRCYERESVPYKAFDGVVDALTNHLHQLDTREIAPLVTGHVAAIPRVFPVLARVDAVARAHASAAEARDPLELRNRVFEGLRILLRKVAARAPLVILIDDLQWADADSLLLLRELLRAPDAPPVLLVVTTRTEAEAAAEDLPGDVRELVLGPLPPEVAQRLALALLGRAGTESPNLAAAIAAEGEGHPLYIDALVRHAALGGARQKGRIRLHDAIWARVMDLGPEARELLEVVCATTAPLPAEVIAGASAIAPSLFSRALGALRVSHFVRGSRRGADAIEPYHDRVRAAVVERLSPEVSVARHRSLIAAIRAHHLGHEQPELLIDHLVACGEDAEAARHCEAAAVRAANALAFDRAAALYEQALALASHPPERERELVIARARALFFAGRLPEAAERFLVAAQGAPREVRLECQQQAAAGFLTAGRIEPGLEVLEQVRTEVGIPFPHTNVGALASLLWVRGRLRLRGLQWKERHVSQIDPEDLTRWDVYRGTALSLAIVDNVRAQTFQSRGLLLALQMGERERALKSLLYEASFICSFGGRWLRRAAAILDDVAPLAESSGDPLLHALVHTGRGISHYFSSRFPSAARDLATAEQLLVSETVGEWGELNVVRTIRLLALLRSGAYGALGQQLRQHINDAERRGDTYMVTSLGRAGAQVWLAEGTPDEAQARLDSVRWMPAAGTYHIQHYWKTIALGEIALYRGEVPASLEMLRKRFADLWRSMVPGAVQMAKQEAHWLTARLELTASRELKQPRRLGHVKKHLARVRREATGFGDVWADLLDAGLHATEGDAEGAVALLRRMIPKAEEYDIRHCAGFGRMRLADLVGGSEADALREQAKAFVAAERIRDVERMIAVFAPGF
ncbi:MAG: hypothetical protein EP329_25450 [Deltaproteobacteria bacterium]|nr:MAG: hypothetical protein EP329_25450 [Deltaproteobacteria bacterium]